jgi:RNA polymerase sigma-70 factor (ECF subfamily)
LPGQELGDEELLRRLRDGHPSAFRELYDRHAALVRGLMVRMVGADADVDDLVQDTLLVVLRRLPTLRDPSALRSFVYSVAVRTARNEVRKRAMRRWVPWAEGASHAPVVRPHDVVVAEVLRRVYVAFDRMGADLRVAYILRHVEGHELTEAAALAECSLATFKRRLRRAEERFGLLATKDPALAQWMERMERHD